MRIIDFHTHTFPDKIASFALDSLQKAGQTRAHTNGTNAGLHNSMQEAGVDVSVVLPVVTNPAKTSSMNQFAAHQNERFEETGIFSIGGIHPDTPNLKEALIEVKNLGLKGVKVHPDYYGVMFDDIRMKRLMDITSEQELFVLTHAGMDIGLYPPTYCTLEAIFNVLDEVQPEGLILAHMGGWMNWEEVTERLAPVMKEYNSRFETGSGKGVYLDTAFSIGDIDWMDKNNHRPYHQMSDDQFRLMVKTFGADRILFATDSPWAEQIDYVNRIKNMGLTEEEQEKIFHINADQVLGL